MFCFSLPLPHSSWYFFLSNMIVSLMLVFLNYFSPFIDSFILKQHLMFIRYAVLQISVQQLKCPGLCLVSNLCMISFQCIPFVAHSWFTNRSVRHRFCLVTIARSVHPSFRKIDFNEMSCAWMSGVIYKNQLLSSLSFLFSPEWVALLCI